MQQWIGQTAGTYTDYFRHKLQEKGDNRVHTDFTQIKVMEAVQKLLHVSTLHPILNQFAYGYLIPQLKELDKIRKEYPVEVISMDAMEGDIPHKLGPGGKDRKNVIHLSTLRTMDEFALPVGFVTWLEKAGESYKKTYFKHLGRNMAENMMYSKTKGKILSPIFSTDMGTEQNPDKVRLSIVAGAKHYLNIGFEDAVYTSPNHIQFDFRHYKINVCMYNLHFSMFYHIAISCISCISCI